MGTEFYNGPYAGVEIDDRNIVARGELATPRERFGLRTLLGRISGFG